MRSFFQKKENEFCHYILIIMKLIGINTIASPYIRVKIKIIVYDGIGPEVLKIRIFF